VPWQPEDWDCWPREVPAAPDGPPVVTQTVQEILRRIPDCEYKTLVDLGGGLQAQLPGLTSAFQQVIVVVPNSARLSRVREHCEGLSVEFIRRDLQRLEPLRERCDIALALGTIGGRRLCELDNALQQIRLSLVEGGMLLGSIAAVPRRGHAYRIRLRSESDELYSPELHEVELHYRLTRARFQGLRIRRVCELDGTEQLLFMAARRAIN
jgi:hypothetical protein